MFYSSKLIKYPIRKQVLDLSITFFITLFTALFMFKTTSLFSHKTNIIQLIIASLTGFTIYIIINYFLKNSPLHQVIQLYKTRNYDTSN